MICEVFRQEETVSRGFHIEFACLGLEEPDYFSKYTNDSIHYTNDTIPTFEQLYRYTV